MQRHELFQLSPYAMPQQDKERFLLAELSELTRHHQDHCMAYRKMLQALQLPAPPYQSLETIPYLPVGLFKTHDLLSIPKDVVYKTLLSSGTTGSVPSRIYLDRETAREQTAALASIITHFLGQQRLPLLIVDREDVIQDPKMFSARGAAILGMLNFGRDPFYLLDSQHQIKYDALRAWLQRYGQAPILIFGFTFMVWNDFIKACESQSIHLDQGILIHTGGWKKLQDQAVTPAHFKQRLFEVSGIRRCHNFYGMVEQVGSVFVECEQGRLHCPVFADIIIRDPQTWQPVSVGQDGVIQTLSLLPRSYPGHSLLTEDLGRYRGEDNCPCRRLGKTFDALGRVPKAEPRGCSDVGETHA